MVSASSTERPRCLVEAGWGLGDVIEAAPACHALWLLGFDVDFFVNKRIAARIAPLFEGHPAYGRVLTARDQVDVSRYDVGVGCFGPSQAVRRVSPGSWFGVSLRDVVREGLAGANLLAARRLGYEGDSPGHLLNFDDEAPAPPPRTVVVHAGCNPTATYKRWPHWEAVCDRLRGLGVPVVVVGTDRDGSESGWERRFDHRVNLPYTRLAALLRGARAYLGTDSGVSHLAGAVGTPGLLLFGPTDPRCYAPDSKALRVLDTPPLPGEGRHPVSRTFPAMDRLGVDTVFTEVSRLLTDPPRAAPRTVPARRESPRGSAEARLPSAREIQDTPLTLDAMDEVVRSTTAAAILGGLARRGDPAALAGWRREVGRAVGLAHLRAATLRRASRTLIGHRRARSHLLQASRAGYRIRAGAQRLMIALTPSSRLHLESDALRH